MTILYLVLLPLFMIATEPDQVNCSYYLDTPARYQPPACSDKKITYSWRNKNYQSDYVAVERGGKVHIEKR